MSRSRLAPLLQGVTDGSVGSRAQRFGYRATHLDRQRILHYRAATYVGARLVHHRKHARCGGRCISIRPICT